MSENNDYTTSPNITNTPIVTNPVLFTKTNLIYIAILIVATLIAFFPTLSCGFVEWDDPANLLQNPQLKEIGETWNWQAIKNIFITDINGNYNPIPIFTFALEKYFFAPVPEASPFVFHFNNLLLHIACTISVFVLFLRLKLGNTGALIGALFFAIHPMRVESVAWVTERKDVLYGLFYILSLLSYIKYISSNTKKWTWYAAALTLAILSCISKVQAVTLPLSFVAIDYYLDRKWLSPKILIIEKLPWWLLSLTFGLINIYYLQKGDYVASAYHISDYNILDKIAIGAYSYATYIAKWIFPYKMTHYYDYPSQIPMLAYVLIAIIPLALFSILSYAKRKQHKFLIFGWLFFTVNVIFMLQIVSVGNAFLADRFTYIAYIGLFFIVGKAYELFTLRFPAYTRYTIAPLAGYFILFAFMTFNQSKVWANTTTLCEHNIKCYPENYYGYNQAGMNLLRMSFPDDNNKIDEATSLKRLQQAQQYFQFANTMDSLSGRKSPAISSDIFQNLGVTYGLTNNNALAIYCFSQAILLTPKSIDAYKNRAYQYFLNKQFQLAIEDYNIAIQYAPNEDDFYYQRANCYYSLKVLPNAMQDLDKAISLNATNPNYFIARSVVYRSLDNIVEARADAHKAQSLGVNVPQQYFE